MINTTYEPFVGLRQAMDQLFNESFVQTPFRTLWSRPGAGTWTLPLDVYATEDEAVIMAAVPGLSPENLQITCHQGTVVLSGEIASPAESEEGKGATWYLRELWSGRFQRAVTLPFEVDADKAEATFEHGIVRIVLPKAEQSKPKKIALKVGEAVRAITGGEGQK